MAPADIADAGRQLAHIGAEVAMLEERWLELQHQLETLQARVGLTDQPSATALASG